MRRRALSLMTDSNDGIDIFDLFVEHFGEKEAKERLNAGCNFKEWKTQARKYQHQLEKCQSEERRGAILENQWETINELGISREEFYSLGNSPLEILRECVLGEFITYPPPEILKVIANQFQYYMLKQGKVSLEHAFFGDSRGRGNYAKRALNNRIKNQMYEKFEVYSDSHKARGMSQEQILLELASIPEDPSYAEYEDGPLNPFRSIANESDDDWVESFLRDYRRWKNEFTK